MAAIACRIANVGNYSSLDRLPDSYSGLRLKCRSYLPTKKNLRFKLRLKSYQQAKKARPLVLRMHKQGSEDVLGEDKKNANSGGFAIVSESSGQDSILSSSGSSLDLIEKKAQQSIDKLKHLLYRLKARPLGETINATIFDDLTREEPLIQNVRDDTKQVFVAQKLPDKYSKKDSRKSSKPKVINGSKVDSKSSKKIPSKKPVEDTLTQFNSLTCTRTLVQFEESTGTATVTITATVRDPTPDLQPSSSEKTIAIAARALSRTCLSFEEKALTSLTESESLEEFSIPLRKSENFILKRLKEGQFISSEPILDVSSAFRPKFNVKLLDTNGVEHKAIFKPTLPGDRYGRWQRAPVDWVAYQLSQLLPIKLVPPTIVIDGFEANGKRMPPGVLIHSVEDIRPLSSLPLKKWGDDPNLIVSNVHILDALLGSSARHSEFFFAGRDWLNPNQFCPVVVDHPIGPNSGQLHPMWSTRGLSYGLKEASPLTIAHLEKINFAILMELFNGALSPREINLILERRNQVLAYFNAQSIDRSHIMLLQAMK